MCNQWKFGIFLINQYLNIEILDSLIYFYLSNLFKKFTLRTFFSISTKKLQWDPYVYVKQEQCESRGAATSCRRGKQRYFYINPSLFSCLTGVLNPNLTGHHWHRRCFNFHVYFSVWDAFCTIIIRHKNMTTLKCLKRKHCWLLICISIFTHVSNNV